MSAAGWDYVGTSWRACCDCHTVRPVTELQESALEVDTPGRMVCKDRVWCCEQVKRQQDKVP